MKTTQRISALSFLFLLFFSISAFKLAPADARFNAKALSIVIKGTSTLHDWEMKSSQGHAEVDLVLGANDKLTDLSGLNFVMPAESLKSEHSMMDNNAYKALKTDKNKNISFVLSSASVSALDATTYQIKTVGKLTIAGNTRETDLVATAKYNAADKSFTITGSKQIQMTQWGVKPPTVMMGTIKTGNDLTITFNTKIAR